MIAAELKDIQFFVISYNHLTYIKHIIQFFQRINVRNVNIIDNHSTFPPLLAYLETCPYRVYYMHKNYGHMVLFECSVFKDLIDYNYFVLTDPDVLPVGECPDDFLFVFIDLLFRNPLKNKVGFALKIDDLPNHYELKENVIAWESRFFEKPVSNTSVTAYDAPVNTNSRCIAREKNGEHGIFMRRFELGRPTQQGICRGTGTCDNLQMKTYSIKKQTLEVVIGTVQ